MLDERSSALRGVDAPSAHPRALDWHRVVLPDAWPDRVNLLHPGEALRYFGRFFARRQVEIPPDLPGAERLPAYLKQEFHHLPNGVYSKRHADAYARWFDRVMLGRTVHARARLAATLAGTATALDAGCGTGGLAGALHAAGVGDVWGIDPSPYVLQIAARRHPEVHFVQGVIEESGFPSGRFDGVGACFLFHELPNRVADASLAEIGRILAPGGKLAIAEPSPIQLDGDLRTLVRRAGYGVLYFALLARWMHEPFVAAWHRRDVGAWLADHGFRLLVDDEMMPIRFITAVRRGS